MSSKLIDLETDTLTGVIIGAAIEVHKTLGPGLLESIYEKCLKYELEIKGLDVKCQYMLPVTYKGISLDADFRIDMLIEDSVILEIKSVIELAAVHEAQLLSYSNYMAVE